MAPGAGGGGRWWLLTGAAVGRWWLLTGAAVGRWWLSAEVVVAVGVDRYGQPPLSIGWD
jgi:hypothetical protein